MSLLHLLVWHTMIRAGVGWWFLDQPGLSLNETVPLFSRNQSRNHTNSSTPEISTNRTWWLWEGSLPWWTMADPNVGPENINDEPLPYEGWWVWGFRLFAWVGGARVFSTPDEGGSLTSQGGWLLFIMDTCGVWMFGSWWPTVGTTACLATAICLLGLTAWSLQVLSQLWCCQCLRAGCRRLWTGEATPDHQFEETPPVRGFKALTLTGPTGVRAVDTEFYNKGVRGRGINRKPHDLVVVLGAGVARLQVDQKRRGRIDRHGLLGSLLPGSWRFHPGGTRSAGKGADDSSLQGCRMPSR